MDRGRRRTRALCRGRTAAIAAVATGLVALLAAPAAWAQDLVPAPHSVAALGDSLTAATGLCPDPACPDSSWSTGSNPVVASHVARIGQLAPGVVAHNFAVPGAKVDALTTPDGGQVQQAIASGADYVTILVGTNDVCRDSLAEMTPESTFRQQFTAALDALTAGLPNARILVASVPDPERLRAIFAADETAKATWAAAGPQGQCAVFLQDPDSSLPGVAKRRARVHDRLLDINGRLAEVCSDYEQCTFDCNALFNWQFTPQDISTSDYFHFSEQGQAFLSALTYPRLGFGAPAPPSSVCAPPPGSTRFPAKLKVKRATIAGKKLNVLLSITGRATGALTFEFQAAGTETKYTVPLGPAREGEKTIRLVRALTGAQRNRTTGILSIGFPGAGQVLADTVRFRAAKTASKLRRTELTLNAGRVIRVGGTIDPKLTGIVRLRVTFVGADGRPADWNRNARIAAGRWRLVAPLPGSAVIDPNAYLTIQYTGAAGPRGAPFRGEQQGKALYGLPTG